MSNIQYVGCAYLAACHEKFPKAALDVFKGVNYPAMAFAIGLFGRKMDVVEAYLKQCENRPHMLEAYLWNPWRDSIKLKALERCGHKALLKLERRVKRYRAWIDKRKSSSCHPVLTYTLEGRTHGVSSDTEALIQCIVQEHWPYATCSNGHYHATLPVYNEIHHKILPKMKNVIYSMDGVSIDFDHRRARIDEAIKEHEVLPVLRDAKNKGAKAVLVWQDRWQDLSEKKVPILQRNPKVPKKDRRVVNEWLRSL